MSARRACRAICSPRTRPPASRCLRCRWRTVSGSGFDPPVVSPQLRATAAAETLEPGMVLAVTAYVCGGRAVGAVFSRDAVLITERRTRGADVQSVVESRRAVGIG